jgi:hypothetical protein
MTELKKEKSFSWIYDGYKESGIVRDAQARASRLVMSRLGQRLDVKKKCWWHFRRNYISSELEANKEKMGDSKTEREMPRKRECWAQASTP